MKSLLVKLVLLSGLTLLVLKMFFDPRFSKESNFEASINEFYVQPKDSLDILILGSSHARNSFNPQIIDKALGLNSFNLGSGGQRIIVTNNLLEDVLKDYSPKLVILDVFPGSLDFPEKSHQKSNQLQVIDNTKWSLKKLLMINKIFDFHEMPAVLSQTIRNHEKWNKMKWKLDSKAKYFESLANHKDALVYKGFSGSYFTINQTERQKLKDYEIKKANYIKSKKTNKAFFEKELEALRNTIEICRDNNVQLMLVCAPYFNAFYNPQGSNFHYLVSELSDKFDVPFVDLNSKYDELGLILNDFRDRVHLNISGSDKVTKYLIQEIIKLDEFKSKYSEQDVFEKMNSFDNSFKEVYTSKVDKEILPNILVTDVRISSNRKFYQVVLDLKMDKKDINLIKSYNLEYFAKVYEKDKKRLKGKFKNTIREYYTFYNNKITKQEGRHQIIFRLPVTDIKVFENIRIFSFKKGQKMTTQDYEFNLKNVDLKIKENANRQ